MDDSKKNWTYFYFPHEKKKESPNFNNPNLPDTGFDIPYYTQRNGPRNRANVHSRINATFEFQSLHHDSTAELNCPRHSLSLSSLIHHYLSTQKSGIFRIWYLLDKLPIPLGVCQCHFPWPMAPQNKKEEEIYISNKIKIFPFKNPKQKWGSWTDQVMIWLPRASITAIINPWMVI